MVSIISKNRANLLNSSPDFWVLHIFQIGSAWLDQDIKNVKYLIK